MEQKSAKDLVAEADREVETLSGEDAVKLVGNPAWCSLTCARARNCKRQGSSRGQCTFRGVSWNSRPTHEPDTQA